MVGRRCGTVADAVAFLRSGTGPRDRTWTLDAIACIVADARRSADTHLVTFPLPPSWGIDLYLKDESTHPTGSLKHRLARSAYVNWST